MPSPGARQQVRRRARAAGAARDLAAGASPTGQAGGTTCRRSLKDSQKLVHKYGKNTNLFYLVQLSSHPQHWQNRE